MTGAATASACRPGLLARIDASGVPLLLARLFVGGMFAYLAYMKLRDPIEFLKQLYGYAFFGPLPRQVVNTTAVVVPWIELLCAVALVLGFWLRGAALTIVGMLLFFYPLLIHRAVGLLHDPPAGQHYAGFCDVAFDCGCGTGVVFICAKLAENTSLLAGAILILLSRSRRWTLDGRRARARGVRPARRT